VFTAFPYYHDSMADILLIAGLIAVFAAALAFVITYTRFYLTKRREKPMRIDDVQRYNACPLCGTKLIVGENLVSRIYSPDSGAGTDKPCTIHGCPHCYPAPKSPHVMRVCPVCNKIIPANGYLLARIFYRYGKKQHVHIAGCSECHKKNDGR
jgi:hypothetical protein